jgi:hypothetical protein
MKSASLTAKLAPQAKPYVDVVGLEIGAEHPDGVPAVRVRKTGDRTELLAAGFLRLPGQLPMTPLDAADAPPVWILPRPYQAPYAALAITTAQGYLRHATGPGEEEPDNKQVPFRTTTRTYGPDLPTFKAGLPEYQAAWAARLLPEGRPPTACSLQVSSAAAVNTFTASPLFKTLTGTTLVLFVFADHTSLVAFHEAKIVLYREHPIGYGHVRTAISNEMRIEAALADSVLQDTFIDPVPMIEPVLKALFRQVEISSDYLLRRRNCQIQQYYLCGLPSGAKYWSTIFSRAMSQPLTSFHPFDGLLKPQRALHLPEDIAAVEPYLAVALGAARAALEDA